MNYIILLFAILMFVVIYIISDLLDKIMQQMKIMNNHLEQIENDICDIETNTDKTKE